VFYGGFMKSLSFECDELFKGVENTECLIRFQPQEIIQVNSQMEILFNGFQLSTALSCALHYFHNNIRINIPSSEFTCEWVELESLLKATLTYP
jgi:hypothetical protein